MSTVRVLSPSAMHSSLEALAQAHTKATGDEVALTFETAPSLKKRLEDGEIADVVIAPPRVMDELIAAGMAKEADRFQLGRAGVGVTVRAGAPSPDISTTETLTRAMLEADSIVHTRASSGLYVAGMIERLGLADSIAAKITTYHDAVGAFTHLLNGKGREIGFGGMPEIVRWRDKGLRLVGPLPEDVQNYTAYLAAHPNSGSLLVRQGAPYGLSESPFILRLRMRYAQDERSLRIAEIPVRPERRRQCARVEG